MLWIICIPFWLLTLQVWGNLSTINRVAGPFWANAIFFVLLIVSFSVTMATFDVTTGRYPERKQGRKG